MAAEFGNTDMIRQLISKGAKVMVKNNEELTVVHVASRAGHEDVLRRILNSVSGIKDISYHYFTKSHPLHLAAENGHQGCCEIIVKLLKVIIN